jgi:hypothetical protein
MTNVLSYILEIISKVYKIGSLALAAAVLKQ